MTTPHRTLLQQALDALESVSAYGRVGTRDVEQAKLQQTCTALREALAAPTPAAPVPDGMVMVPREPTPEMLAVVRNGPMHETWTEGYCAMIAASPAAPVVPNGCEKIFTHKWLDPDCIEQGCKSLAAPVVREPLQEHEILALFMELNKPNKLAKTPVEMFICIVRAIEAAHGITGASK